MVSKNSDEEYELVPESKFHELEAKVEYISKSPFVSTPGVEKIGAHLEGTQDSILSLLEVLKQIANASTFDDAETDILKKQIKPLTKEIKELKNQNETLANSMVEILNKLETMEQRISSGSTPLVAQVTGHNLPNHPSPTNENLPKLEGGPEPPYEFNDLPPEPIATPASSPVDTTATNSLPPVTIPENSASPIPTSADLPQFTVPDANALPPPLGGKLVDGIPPLEKPKKGLFK